MRELILASASPRRKELLETLGYPFTIVKATGKEEINPLLSKEAIVKDLAYHKGKEVYSQYPDALVLAADTIVVCDDEIMGKPKDTDDARRMLKKLRNRDHRVITGVVFLSKEEQRLMSDSSTVYFNDISDQEIEDYILTDEAYDKAGAYAIQGWAGKYISKIDGNYYTIMGLPLSKVYAYLKIRERR